MELWLTLVALYAWQCTVWLHGPAAVFGPRWLGAGRLHRLGPQWLSPWPSTLGVVATRLPFRLVDEGRAVEIGADDGLAVPRILRLDAPPPEQRGARLLVEGRTLLRASSRAEARHWLACLGALAAHPATERPAEMRRLHDDALDADALRARLADARRATRWLAWTCDAYALLVFAGVPAVGAVLGGEYVLAASAPGLAALHLFAVVLAALAHRRLFPARRGERLEELFMAALYPPALLRRPQAWVDAATTGFHPLAWLQVAAPGEAAQRAFTGERTRLELAARRGGEAAEGLRAELEAIDAHAPADWTRATHRRRDDPTAESFCPVCWDDFRAGFDRCTACDASTVPYLADPA